MITITQGALMRDPFNDNEFSIYIPRVIADLTANGGNLEHLHQAEYFLVRMDDLEEVMQMNIRRLYVD
ncbi:hypothetical protein [Bacillus suaedae]|uniref:Uncharacterized protein n=1 Tax=Halalkalibacter suaedae TaxID=2822140 RepID=A0A940WQ56_9BACI|nr:hypothetical protein [Bacillus suaedae]MBP3950296.1 hypothetical protein [Bacillus suaedae]